MNPLFSFPLLALSDVLSTHRALAFLASTKLSRIKANLHIAFHYRAIAHSAILLPSSLLPILLRVE